MAFSILSGGTGRPPAKPGQFYHLVTIQQPVRVANDTGEKVLSWQAVGLAYARIEPIGGRELWLAQAAQASSTHRVTLRYRPGLTTDCRLLYQDRVFQIDGIDCPEERRKFLVLLVKEAA